MHQEITIFNIGRSACVPEEVERWLARLGVTDGYMERLADDVSNGKLKEAEVVPGLAAKRCYMAFETSLNPNLTKVRDDWTAYFDNILNSKHGAVLEHSTFSFAIEGVSRVFTGEMNRHRAGWSISEGSGRYIRYDNGIAYWTPLSIQGPDALPSTDSFLYDIDDNLPSKEDMAKVVKDLSIDERKHLTRAVFEDVFRYVERRYAHLLEIWNLDDRDFAYKKAVTSCLRRIIPMGMATGGVWTGNIRALRHVMTLRCAPEAEEEIRYVFSTITAMLSEQMPNVFGDFKQDDKGFWRPKHYFV